MIVAEASLDEFRDACRKYGMRTLREAGLMAIHAGPDQHRGNHAGDDAGDLSSGQLSVVSGQRESSRDADRRGAFARDPDCGSPDLPY